MEALIYILGLILMIIVPITLFSIEIHLKNGNKQNEEIIELLKQIKNEKNT